MVSVISSLRKILTGLYIGISVLCINCSASEKNRSADESTQTTQAVDSVSADSTAQLTLEELEAQKRQQELEQQYIRELSERYQGRANGITTFYSSAQRLFYMGKFQSALYHINKAAEIKETADILALRGSIYLGLGDIEKFTEQWRLALEMDNEVPIPNIPYLIQQLKKEGLIGENYNPQN